jgi:uncharacterized protein
MKKLFAVLVASLFFFSFCNTKMKHQEKLTTIAFRLKPNEDLKQGIEKVIKDNNVKAGFVITAVGSLITYNLRFANMPIGKTQNGHFEIVSLVGTLGVAGSHLHMSISDSSGATIGGHLLDGNKIYTTAEIVIGVTNSYVFNRAEDGTTPYKELQIEHKK